MLFPSTKQWKKKSNETKLNEDKTFVFEVALNGAVLNGSTTSRLGEWACNPSMLGDGWNSNETST